MIFLREMKLSDLQDVVNIENQSYKSPWSEDNFRKEITLNTRAKYFVLVEDTKIIGYIGTWIISDEGHITNVAVHPLKRKKGYGKILVEKAINYLKSKNASHIVLEVRVSNQPAINLYEKFDFKIITKRIGYYHDNNEDAYVMIKELS